MEERTKTQTANERNPILAIRRLAKLLDGSSYHLFIKVDPELKEVMEESSTKPTKRKSSPRSINEYPEIMEDVEIINKLLNTTSCETLLFSAIYAIQFINNSPLSMSELHRYLEINGFDFIPLVPYFKSLKRKHLIREIKRRCRNEYVVNKTAVDAIIDNKQLAEVSAPDIDRFQFCKNISALIESRQDEDIDTYELIAATEEHECDAEKLKFIQNLKVIVPDTRARLLFYEVCNDFTEEGIYRNKTLENTLSHIYEDYYDRIVEAQSILKGKHILIVRDLVTTKSSTFFSDAELVLTEKGKELFLENEYDLFRAGVATDKRLLSPEKIPARELFFNPKLTKDIDFLKNSLMETEFVKLQQRLEENSLPKGVSVLFHGLPGTGKTAVAEMLAKSTGRSVYHVDIAASRSCWYGESEKLFKRIFTDYRQMCEKSAIKPILLFNEADALFSTRQSIGTRQNTQTENTLQNILLEEMEKLDGILIATTNLSENFDNAFERRFLFKINFGKPDITTKAAIWKSKLSWLDDEDCRKLAEKYELSGGEIDNIVRKCIMEEVLTNTRPDVNMLLEWCKSEKIDGSTPNKLGFAC